MNKIVVQLTEWRNEYIRLCKQEISVIRLSDMYRYVAVLLLFHSTGFNFSKTIDVLRQSTFKDSLDVRQHLWNRQGISRRISCHF